VCWKAGWLVVGAGITKSAKEPKEGGEISRFLFIRAPFSEENVFSFRPSRSVTQSMEHMVHDELTCALTSQGTVRRVCTAGIYVEPRVTVGFSSASHELREALLQQLGGLSMQCTRRRQHFASTWVLREPHTLTNER
tara:strand:- start:10 stop:420 length:411 start_codon:yes stop_codon:yes gene_type:complete